MCVLLVVGGFEFGDVFFEGCFDVIVLIVGGVDFVDQFVLGVGEVCMQVFFECQQFVDWYVVEVIFVDGVD